MAEKFLISMQPFVGLVSIIGVREKLTKTKNLEYLTKFLASDILLYNGKVV